eukprot:6620922-Prymnesium_polylepis.1
MVTPCTVGAVFSIIRVLSRIVHNSRAPIVEPWRPGPPGPPPTPPIPDPRMTDPRAVPAPALCDSRI